MLTADITQTFWGGALDGWRVGWSVVFGPGGYIPTEGGCKMIEVDEYDGLGNLRFRSCEARRGV